MSEDEPPGPPVGFGEAAYWDWLKTRALLVEKRALYDHANPAQKAQITLEIIDALKSFFLSVDEFECALRRRGNSSGSAYAGYVKEGYVETIRELAGRYGESIFSEAQKSDPHYLVQPIFHLGMRLVELSDLGKPLELDAPVSAKGRTRLPFKVARNRTLAVAAAEILILAGVKWEDAFDEAALCLVAHDEPNRHWNGEELEVWLKTELMKKAHFKRFRDLHKECVILGFARLRASRNRDAEVARQIVQEQFYSRMFK